MAPELTLREAGKIIKADEPKLIADIDQILGLGLLLTAACPTPEIAATALTLLGAKNELIKLGKFLIERITAKRDRTLLARQQRMSAAYCVVCYAAFFEAVSDRLGIIQEVLKLDPNDKLLLSRTAAAKSHAQDPEVTDDVYESSAHDLKVCLPHPADSAEAQSSYLLSLYSEMTKALLAFFEAFAAWESSDSSTRDKVFEIARKLPEAALERLKGAYYELAAKYPDFYVWSNLKEHRSTQAQLGHLSGYISRQLELIDSSKQSIDLGFAKLAEVVEAIPAHAGAKRAKTVFDELGKSYKNNIDKPIIDEQFSPDVTKPTLSYPKKSEIFVPQAFRVIRYTGKEQLESETTWSRLDVRDDLGPFLLSCLASAPP